jgi:hypothetical protein
MATKTQTNATKTAAPTSALMPTRPFVAPTQDHAAPNENVALPGHRFAAIDTQPRPTLLIQPKLRLGPTNDHYEQEADRIAAHVSSGRAAPAAQVHSRQPQIQRVASAPSAGIAVAPHVEAGINAARGGGQPLPNGVRAQMEGALGADFSGVRVHSDSRANALNQAVQARAFTTGHDVFFGRGEYQPGSSEGRRVLAHELVHVVQQYGTAVDPSNYTISPLLQRDPDKEEEHPSIETKIKTLDEVKVEEIDDNTRMQYLKEAKELKDQVDRNDEAKMRAVGILIGKFTREKAKLGINHSSDTLNLNFVGDEWNLFQEESRKYTTIISDYVNDSSIDWEKIIKCIWLLCEKDENNSWKGFLSYVSIVLNKPASRKYVDRLSIDLGVQFHKMSDAKLVSNSFGNYKGAAAEIEAAIDSINSRDLDSISLPGNMNIDEKYQILAGKTKKPRKNNNTEKKHSKEIPILAKLQDVDLWEEDGNNIWIIEVKSDIEAAIHAHGTTKVSEQMIRYLGIAATTEKDQPKMVHLVVEIVKPYNWLKLFVGGTAALYASHKIALRIAGVDLEPWQITHIDGVVREDLKKTNLEEYLKEERYPSEFLNRYIK